MVSSAIGRNPFFSVVPDAVTRALVKLYISFENTDLSRLEEYFFITIRPSPYPRKDICDGKENKKKA